MTKYLATDLDGTLLHPTRKYSYVCKENKEAIKIFNENVIIVSGRNPKFIKNVCKEINIKETFVACNGASIYANGKELMSFPIDINIVNDIIKYTKDNFSDYTIILFDNHSNIYSITSDLEKSLSLEKEIKKRNPKTAYIANRNIKTINKLLQTPDSIIKLNVALNKVDKQKLFDYLKSNNYKLSYSICINSVEITDNNVNKGTSLLKLVNHLKLNHDDILVIGDDTNDLPMFELFKNSFLVKSKTNKHLEEKVSCILEKFKDISNKVEEQ